MRDRQYRAFISYSHADRKWARWLHRKIEGYRTPKHLIGQQTPSGPVPARLTPVFCDREDLPSAHDLSERIRDALEASESLVVVCSPQAAASRYANQEIETFKRLGRSANIFSLIVAGDPGAPGTADDCFPAALRRRYDAAGHYLSGGTEPIAADARPGGDGRSLARLKIIAGLLGVGLDDLRQRELQRKLRRMVVATAASLVALAVTVVLAVSAHLARQEAEQRRGQAEDLLSFMVEDLRDSLEPLGRLDLLEKVGGKAMDYFATVKLGDLSDEELTRHAQVITQLGEIRVSQRQYDEALRSFSEAHARSAELYRNDSGNGDRLFNRGQAEFWVGYVHWRRGDLDSARVWLTRYLETSQALTAMDPSRQDWAIEVVYGHHNLAVLALDARDPDAAREGFTREIDSLQALDLRDEGLDARRDTADAYSWLGNIAFSGGDLPEALRHYEQATALYEALQEDAPDDRTIRYSWAHAANFVVQVRAFTGEREDAARLADDAIEVLDALVVHDPHNMEWLRSSAKPRITRAALYAADGRWDEARALAAAAIGTLEDMASGEQADLSIHEALADAYLLLAWVAHATADTAAAEQAISEARSRLEAIGATGPLSDERRGRLASALVLLGELHSAAGQAAEAGRAWQDALDVVGASGETSESPYVRDPELRALILSGRSDEAEQLRARLDQRGYRPLRPWPSRSR